MFISLSFETELKTGKFSTAMLDIRYKETRMRTVLIFLGNIKQIVGCIFWISRLNLKVYVGVGSKPIHASQFDITHKVPLDKSSNDLH